MKNKVLFIEDNKTKIDDVKFHVFDNYKNINLTIKESFTSGLRELFTSDYDFVFLDMSLPTREGATNNSLNNFEQLGGHKILSEMKRKNKIIPTILITMFSEFGVGQSFMDLKEVDEMCKEQFNDFYKGVVYYTLREDSWKEKLNGYLDDLL
jgi:CheY-like chemotaxis protein